MFRFKGDVAAGYGNPYQSMVSWPSPPTCDSIKVYFTLTNSPFLAGVIRRALVLYQIVGPHRSCCCAYITCKLSAIYQSWGDLLTLRSLETPGDANTVRILMIRFVGSFWCVDHHVSLAPTAVIHGSSLQ